SEWIFLCRVFPHLFFVIGHLHFIDKRAQMELTVFINKTRDRGGMICERVIKMRWITDGNERPENDQAVKNAENDAAEKRGAISAQASPGQAHGRFRAT